MKAAIGEVAGQVWQELNQTGSISAAKLKTKLKSDAFSVNAAIGWLAREDKVELKKAGNSVNVALKE